ncbi:MAG: heavy metal translocating P-type ATPase [Brevundimonas sp.]|uniref:heavy metal translocating P-type ATPase n=1 Tax=Brevundimonas sp. TaxID=1871086 RepID=UPI000DB1E84C|nr:heavy metal translocating P-type ATPase [Brevundimonas sp.]MBD3835384.1 heavy metal translocating P-type ATPase [Brevundimonas sp.]PZU71961.1 MAG: heavy metal translocating P-type ATPase [Brevundimonas sp.]
MSKTLRLNIPVLLPHAPDSQDGCVGRLIALVRAEPGILEAHLVEGAEGAELCIHYDPDQLSLAQVRRRARQAGAEVSERFGHLSGRVDGVRHARHARTLAAALADEPGVIEAALDAAGAIRLEFDREKTTREAVIARLASHGLSLQGETAGAAPSDGGGEANAPIAASTHNPDDSHDHSHSPDDGHDHGHAEGDGHDHGHGGFLGPNTELIFALGSGVTLGLGWIIETFIPALPEWLPFGLFLVAYALGGWFTVGEAIGNLRRKRFEIDTLMLVAAAGAAALGAWAEGALLLFLFSLGHALEHYAMGRAKKAIEALAALAPRTAHVRRGDEVVELPVEQLEVGDVVVVRPNERLPADGFVVKGTTSVNQAPVTGESIPVDKQPVESPEAARARPSAVSSASVVFAGTINGGGAIEIETTRRSNDTTLAKVVRMVSEAETQKSPTQRFTDRFERVFVPLVLGLAFVLLFAWVVVDEPFRDSFYRAMAVLVAASPCALAIATPSAVLSGVARAARAGVLVKGGAPLENLGALDAIAFDKTGTLTEGRPRITDVVPFGQTSESELLEIAVAVERLSDHPLAEAIVRDGSQRLVAAPVRTASDLRSLTGKGVTARLDDQDIWIGKPEMFGEDAIAPLGPDAEIAVAALRNQGRTLMVIRRGTRDLGVIGLLDTPRAKARETLTALRALGIRRMIMISGDHQKAAQAVAGQVGLTEAWGDLMPEDKVDAIKKLRGEARVAMVGDGVNDAPAMATATVGIAMGAAGSDVALETADVALMADDLSRLPFTVGLSRQTRRIIRQNLFVSLGVVAFLVPATIFGLGIGPAVALHEGSTLLVVFNALRLLAWRDPRGAD